MTLSLLQILEIFDPHQQLYFEYSIKVKMLRRKQCQERKNAVFQPCIQKAR